MLDRLLLILQSIRLRQAKLAQAVTEAQEARWDAESAQEHVPSEHVPRAAHFNAGIGYSEMLQEEAEDLGQDTFVPDLKKIHGAGKHLLALLNNGAGASP